MNSVVCLGVRCTNPLRQKGERECHTSMSTEEINGFVKNAAVSLIVVTNQNGDRTSQAVFQQEMCVRVV